MLGYILISHGPKPDGPLRSNAAAQQQIAHLEQFAETHGAKLDLVADYARRIDCLASLPRLKAVLEKVTSGGEASIFIDDLRRLFRICAPDHRISLLNELSVHAYQILVLRSNTRLSAFTAPMHTELLLRPDGHHFISKGSRAARLSKVALGEQTENARQVSATHRTKHADQHAHLLATIRDNLLAKHAKVTNQMIADKANVDGLLAPRGGQWRRDTVAKTLQRLKLKPEV